MPAETPGRPGSAAEPSPCHLGPSESPGAPAGPPAARVYTARYNYRGPDRFDVTLRGAREARKRGLEALGEPFAPPAWLLHYAKGYSRFLPAGVDPPAEGDGFDWYATHYLAAMRRSYVEHRGAWAELLARPEVTLVCFCADPNACHRGLLAGILVRCGAQYLGERR